MFRLCVSSCACVSALCFGLCLCFGFVFRAWVSIFVSSCEFSAFFFFSSSLVLMGTTGLWLCSDFYGFDSSCSCMLVVE